MKSHSAVLWKGGRSCDKRNVILNAVKDPYYLTQKRGRDSSEDLRHVLSEAEGMTLAANNLTERLEGPQAEAVMVARC